MFGNPRDYQLQPADALGAQHVNHRLLLGDVGCFASMDLAKRRVSIRARGVGKIIE